MMGAGRILNVTLSASAEVFEASAPLILTGIVAAESSGLAAATLAVLAGDGGTVYMMLSVPAGQTFVWSGRVALPAGLQISADVGAAYVSAVWE